MRRDFSVREAKPSDKEIVLKFCEHTFEWGDYIPDVWDRWLTESNGKLFVATFKDLPVGISYVAILKKGEAWLQGARTAAEFRRKGVASLLNRACLEFAIKRGAKVARLITESNNFATQAAMAKLGFKRIADWVFMEFDGCELETCSGVRWAEKADVEEIWKFLASSECYVKSAGLYSVVFSWISFGRADLKKFVERRMTLVYERNKEIRGLVLVDDTIRLAWQENSVQTCYVDGDFSAALEMGRFLKTHCYNEGIAKIYGVMANYVPLILAFSELGFRKGGNTELVYEKRLF